ncbi:MAG: hypothetical protein P4L83_00750 [Nevskia sp.]|nr:hypothetical protein [Nevskia sp.]
MFLPLLLAYPLLVHLAVLWHRPWLQCAALVCAYTALFYRPLRAWRPSAWLGLALASVCAYLLVSAGDGLYALYLPSIAIPCLVLSAFAPSLLPGRVPLITRIADSMSGPLSPEQVRYTRAVTWVWTVTVGSMLLVTVGLLLFGSVEAWSVFANFLSYALLGALFAGEYAYRRLRFPEHTPMTFRAFLRSVTSYRPH